MTRNFARILAKLAATGGVIALTACNHAMPGGSSGDRTAASDDDPWISRGSVSAGPIWGNPAGPYTPRQ